MSKYEDEYDEQRVREARERLAVRLGYRTSAALIVLAAFLFITAIVMESGKTAGVGGVVVALAAITLIVTTVYDENH